MFSMDGATDAYVGTYLMNRDDPEAARELARFSGLLFALEDGGIPEAKEGMPFPDVTAIADLVALEGDEKLGHALNN